jgi:hypothetical protein
MFKEEGAALRDLLWLDPIDCRECAPFTGQARDYKLIRRACA